MTSYLAWYEKKRETFRRREVELLRMLHNSEPAELVPRAAFELQEAKIRVLRSEYSRLDLGDGTHAVRLAKLKADLATWSLKDLEAIVEEYRLRLKSDGPC